MFLNDTSIIYGMLENTMSKFLFHFLFRVSNLIKDVGLNPVKDE